MIPAHRTVIAIVVACTAMVVGLGTAVPATASPPTGLSKNGRYLWQFEALLADTFHSKQVAAVACDRQERRFLISYSDAAGLGLDCLTPS